MNYKKILSLFVLIPGLMLGMRISDRLARLKKELEIQESNVNKVGPLMRPHVQSRISTIKKEIIRLEGSPGISVPAVTSPPTGPATGKLVALKNELKIHESRINQMGSAMQKQVQIRINAIKSEIARLEGSATAVPAPAVTLPATGKLAALKDELKIHESRINQMGPEMQKQTQIRINAIKNEIAQLEGSAAPVPAPAVQRSAIEGLKQELKIQEAQIDKVGPAMQIEVQNRINQLKAQIQAEEQR